MRVDDAPPPRRTLSLTPLIDVVFLLLMFFMLASTFARFSVVDVSLAGSPPAGVASLEAPILLTVAGEGRFTLNGEPVAARDIAARLVEMAGGENRAVLVRPGAQASSQDVVTALERARGAGVGGVALAR